MFLVFLAFSLALVARVASSCIIIHKERKTNKIKNLSLYYSHMKKGGTLLLILYLLLVPTILAQEDTTPKENGLQEDQDLTNPFEKIDKKLEEPINLPPVLKQVAGLLMGFPKGTEPSPEQIIILCVVVLFVGMLIREITDLLPFVEGTLYKWIVSVGVVLLIAIAGGFEFVVVYVLDFRDILPFLKSNLLGNILIIIFLVLLGFFLRRLFWNLTEKGKDLDAELQGERAAEGISTIEAIRNAFSSRNT